HHEQREPPHQNQPSASTAITECQCRSTLANELCWSRLVSKLLPNAFCMFEYCRPYKSRSAGRAQMPLPEGLKSTPSLPCTVLRMSASPNSRPRASATPLVLVKMESTCSRQRFPLSDRSCAKLPSARK